MEERNKRSSVHSVQCENMNKSILMRRSANEWMRISKHIPMPKMLFSEFWYEGEICFLFADYEFIIDSLQGNKNNNDCLAINSQYTIFPFYLKSFL